MFSTNCQASCTNSSTQGEYESVGHIKDRSVFHALTLTYCLFGSFVVFVLSLSLSLACSLSLFFFFFTNLFCATVMVAEQKICVFNRFVTEMFYEAEGQTRKECIGQFVMVTKWSCVPLFLTFGNSVFLVLFILWINTSDLQPYFCRALVPVAIHKFFEKTFRG